MSEYIQIHQGTYQELVRCQNKLYALEAAGVDCWEGYDYAMEILYREVEDNEDD